MNPENLPEYLVNPAFVHILHIPGLELGVSSMTVAGLSLRRLDWIEWLIIENGDIAERMKGEFGEGCHSFLVADRPDFRGGETAAGDLATCDMASLNLLVTALRLFKPGELLNPDTSVQYQRRGSLNSRSVGRSGRNLFNLNRARQYLLQKDDGVQIEALMHDLSHPEVSGDSTIRLALRHFNYSYDHHLDIEERLLHVFTALEATFGEYKKSARPVSGVSLGRSAAALWPAGSSNTVAAFLDDKTQARGLRNAAAHGDFSGWTHLQIETMIERLREVLRVGLRHLLRMASHRATLVTDLECVFTGLSAIPVKSAYQKTLGYAANGSSLAATLLRGLI